MTDPVPAADPPRSHPRLKVLYLLAVSVAVFVVPAVNATRPVRWYVVPGLLALQAAILLARVSPLEILRSVTRIKWLFLFLLVCYAVLPGGEEDVWRQWKPLAAMPSIAVNLTGLETASLMCLQILTVIWVSSVVRLFGRPTDLVDGLRGFGVPRLFALSIDTTLALLGGVRPRGMGGGGGGGGRGRGMGGGGGGRWREAELRDQRPEGDSEERAARPNEATADAAPNPIAESPPPLESFGRLLRGDVGFFVQSIERSLLRAKAHVGSSGAVGTDERLAHDVSVISGVALAMMSLKMLKVLPGVQFMPGLKTLFFYPLYILAAHLTYSRWGGTTAGAIMGVIGYMQGDGQYGVFEILKHLVAGLVIDLVWPMLRRVKRSAWVYCVFGFVVAIARTTTEIVIMLLLLARLEAFLFVALKLGSNMIAGTLSGLVTYFVLPAFSRHELSAPEQSAAPTGQAAAQTTDSPAPETELAQAPREPT